jgi:uncharacterized membrane protein YqaE (UPF0057 family)
MRYLIAIILPPLAILLCGKPLQAIIALILQITILGWIPAAVWAVLVVHSYQADQRTNRIVKALRRQGR